MDDGLSRRKPSSHDEPDPEKSGLSGKDEHGGVHKEEPRMGQSTVQVRGHETSAETRLERGLKARHITMIAIGGAVGTGLVIGTGKALAQAGPASVFISYLIIGFVVFLVMAGLGEMASWLPIASGFTGYAARFCDPSLGFALGWL
ncbi:hypothetical protein IMZ48_20655 [Candidatus Bathyarchaeota archaeon]|nr:hypothetical protein [Candidatus Bathyarchaeota archaeon]